MNRFCALFLGLLVLSQSLSASRQSGDGAAAETQVTSSIEVGVCEVLARVYDPQMGRFLSADPVVQNPNNLQCYNRYSYCMNNPLGYTDPTGYSGIPRVNVIGWKNALGTLFGTTAEIAVGGKTETGPFGMATNYAPPQDGVGGMVGGVAETVALRQLNLMESSPSSGGQLGAEFGASFVPVLNSAECAFTGETVTGNEISTNGRLLYAASATVETVAAAKMLLPSVAAVSVPTIQQNAAQGKAFEGVVGGRLAQTNTKVASQVTIKTGSGVSTRIDFVSQAPDGSIRLTEAKSSATAPLTKNQRAAFPEIEQNGGTVTGDGKPGYERGTSIPPTKVEVVRPEDISGP